MDREIFPQWCAPPPELHAASGRVDLWRIELAPPSGLRAVGTPVMTPRALAHAAMRDILGRYLRRAAHQVPIQAQPGGKPYVALPGSTIEFNLSHCPDLALLAVTAGHAVGVDVEAGRHIADPLRVAGRMFPEQDVALLAALPAAQRVDRFLDLWTRMEARQKAIGRGIFARPADPASLSSMTFRPTVRHHASVSLALPQTAPDFRFFVYH